MPQCKVVGWCGAGKFSGTEGRKLFRGIADKYLELTYIDPNETDEKKIKESIKKIKQDVEDFDLDTRFTEASTEREYFDIVLELFNEYSPFLYESIVDGFYGVYFYPRYCDEEIKDVENLIRKYNVGKAMQVLDDLGLNLNTYKGVEY